MIPLLVIVMLGSLNVAGETLAVEMVAPLPTKVGSGSLACRRLLGRPGGLRTVLPANPDLLGRRGEQCGMDLGALWIDVPPQAAPAKLPLFDPVFPLFEYERPVTAPHGKNGRSCSPR